MAEVTTGSGSWPKFSAYELRGDRICPVEGAEMSRYDINKVVGGLTKQAPRIYEELSPVIEGIDVDGWGNLERPLTNGEVREVLAWCGKYGLLGLLHHEARLIVLAPRWRVTHDREDDGVVRRHRTAYQISYLRTAHWWEQSTSVHHVEGVFTDVEKDFEPGMMQHDEVARLEDLDARSFQAPRAFARTIGERHGEVQSLTKAIGPYLPRDQHPAGRQEREAEAYPLLMPDSDEFWRAYGEPVDAFVRAFNRIISGIKGLQDPSGWRGDVLDGLLDPVGLSVRRLPDGTLREEVVSPTLLAAMAVAAGHAVADGRRGGACAHCGKLFFTHKKLGIYCTPAHRRAAQNKRQRSRSSKRKVAKPKAGARRR